MVLGHLDVCVQYDAKHLDTELTPHTETKSKRVIDLNRAFKTVKLVDENRRKST